MAVDQNRPVIGIEKPWKEADQGCFAATVLAHQSDRFPMANLELNVGEDGPSRLVGKANIAEFDIRLVLQQSRRAAVGCDFRRAIQKPENAIRGRGPRLYSSVDAGELPHRVG